MERSAGAEEKRRLILDAAVRVFAHKGFHTSRVGDIAEEAGVAHGLLYHYFSSKDEVLDTIFRETWSDLLAEIDDIEGARALGIRAILLDRDEQYPAEPDRIVDLRSLPAVLGILGKH